MKKSEAEVLVIAPPPTCLAGHQFPLKQIQFVIEKLVLAARTGLRGAARVCGIVAEFFGVALRDEPVAFVTAESAAARSDERLPGSSEILESALGQLKSLEGDHQKGGFTGLLLSLGALVDRLDAPTISSRSQVGEE